MIKKLFGLTLILLTSLCMCGCDKDRVVLLFNNQPITRENVQNSMDSFELGETTNYVIYVPKGFKSPYLRLQFVKKETKTLNWGFNVYRSTTVKVDTSKKYYIGAIKIDKPGTYILTAYYLDNLSQPIVSRGFFVK